MKEIISINFSLKADQKEAMRIREVLERIVKRGSVTISNYGLDERIYTQITGYSMK